MKRKKIVICGATGNQGGAVAREFLKDPAWEVFALTRDPGSAAALLLQDLGAQLVRADTNDQASLVQAFGGADAVFGITQPWQSDKGRYDTVKEIRQAKNIVWASRERAVKHLVFSSFINFDDAASGIPFLDSKLAIEGIVKMVNVPYTVLRVSIYMDSLLPAAKKPKEFVIPGNYDAQVRVPYIALADVGSCVKAVLEDTSGYSGRTVDLVGDYISGKDLADVFRSVDRSANYSYEPAAKLWLKLRHKETYKLRKYFERFDKKQSMSPAALALANGRVWFRGTMALCEYLRQRSR